MQQNLNFKHIHNYHVGM